MTQIYFTHAPTPCCKTSGLIQNTVCSTCVGTYLLSFLSVSFSNILAVLTNSRHILKIFLISNCSNSINQFKKIIINLYMLPQKKKSTESLEKILVLYSKCTFYLHTVYTSVFMDAVFVLSFPSHKPANVTLKLKQP